MEADRTVDILMPLMCAYPNARIKEDTIQVYSIALSELSEVELTAGVLKCMRTCKFFPSIAEIMEASQDMVKVVTGTKEKSSDEAWEEVCQQRIECWPNRNPTFSSSEIEKAVSAMGWRSLCTAEEKDIGTTRAQFRGFYESACKRSKDRVINDNVISIMGGEKTVQNLLGDVCRLMPGMDKKKKESAAS